MAGNNVLTWGELTEKKTMDDQGVAVDIRGVNKRFITQQGD